MYSNNLIQLKKKIGYILKKRKKKKKLLVNSFFL